MINQDIYLRLKPKAKTSIVVLRVSQSNVIENNGILDTGTYKIIQGYSIKSRSLPLVQVQNTLNRDVFYISQSSIDIALLRNDLQIATSNLNWSK